VCGDPDAIAPAAAPHTPPANPEPLAIVPQNVPSKALGAQF